MESFSTYFKTDLKQQYIVGMFPCRYSNNYPIFGQFHRISLYGSNTIYLTNPYGKMFR